MIVYRQYDTIATGGYPGGGGRAPGSVMITIKCFLQNRKKGPGNLQINCRNSSASFFAWAVLPITFMLTSGTPESESVTWWLWVNQ